MWVTPSAWSHNVSRGIWNGSKPILKHAAGKRGRGEARFNINGGTIVNPMCFKDGRSLLMCAWTISCCMSPVWVTAQDAILPQGDPRLQQSDAERAHHDRLKQ